MRKIYISGCITNGGSCTELQKTINKNQFHNAEMFLIHDGWETINPLKIPKPCEKPTWRQCLEKDIEALIYCDAIYMLRGWEKSKGARLELHIAMELKFEIFFA